MTKIEFIFENNITKPYIVLNENGSWYKSDSFNNEIECENYIKKDFIYKYCLDRCWTDLAIEEMMKEEIFSYIDTKKLVKDQLKKENYKIINLTKLKDNDEIKGLRDDY